MNKLITIGIPAFNRPAGLRNSLEAICGQSYLNTEILVSDNCSTDDGVEQVAREFCNRDARVKYYRQSNNIGVYRNCEFLANAARGELFMIASDDDGWDIDYVEKLAIILENDSRAVLAVSTVFYRRGNSVIEFSTEERMEEKFDMYAEINTENRILWHLKNSWDGEGHLIYGLIRAEIAKIAFNKVLSHYEHRIATDLQIVFFLVCCGPIAICRDTKKYYFLGDTISANFSFNIPEIVSRFVNYARIICFSKNVTATVKMKALVIILIKMGFKLLCRIKGRALNVSVRAMKLLKIHKFYQAVKRRLLQ